MLVPVIFDLCISCQNDAAPTTMSMMMKVMTTCTLCLRRMRILSSFSIGKNERATYNISELVFDTTATEGSSDIIQARE